MNSYSKTKSGLPKLAVISRNFCGFIVAYGSRICASMAAVVVMVLASVGTASAQSFSWDNSWSNPYVSSGNGDQCTAYAFGRYKVVNGVSLRFIDGQGRLVYPGGGSMFRFAVETSTTYRDSAPVRGALASWTKDGEPGHAGSIERVNNSDGSCDISEQNWPTGWGPNGKTLSAADIKNRPSKRTTGTVYYTLAGFVCPNRPSAFGTLYTNKTATTLQVQFALMDEDRRQVNLLSAIVDGQTVVPGTTISGNVSSNVVVKANYGNTSQLRRGKTYTIYVWATDFRGLRSNKSTTFTW